MNRIFWSAALVFSALFQSGCATGPKFGGLEPIPPAKAQIYFLREAKVFGAGMSFDLLVDGVKVGALPNGGYLPLAVTPGRHTLSAQAGALFLMVERKTEIEVAADSRAFVLVTLRNRLEGRILYWSFGFDEANDEFAVRLLANLNRASSN
ncbi:MAG: DUF2846 domain-containing protein [Burkholderiales bacterium]|nr:DUF2846 domain-containing protein [Burkholderiales bacterium]